MTTDLIGRPITSDERDLLAVLEPAPDRPLGDGEAARPVVRPHERIFLERRADEDAVVQPLGLDELELPLEMRAREDEDDAPCHEEPKDDGGGSAPLGTLYRL